MADLELQATASTQQRVFLTFDNVTFEVENLKTDVKRRILKGVSGSASPGEMVAIMGSSGAGKTSLLNILASRLQEQTSSTSSRSTITGDLMFNGVPSDRRLARQLVAYVMQDDLMMGTMTPRELISFSARLRLPACVSDEEVTRKTEHIIQDLELGACADTRVGTAEERGLSGGERKRVAIGIELVTNPSCIFLDEPTSGLDSFTAFSVMTRLKNLAQKDGRTVLCTIHQPSSDIFNLFDKLILLNNGNIIYQGPATEAVDYFAKQGYQCPKYSNPADYFMKVMAASPPAALEKLADTYKELHTEPTPIASTAEQQQLQTREETRISGFDTMKMLSRRAVVNYLRQPETTKVRMGQTIFMALLTGLLYLQIGNNQKSIRDREGALFFIVTNNFMFSIFAVVLTFPIEKVLFQREKANNMYSTTHYFFSKIMSEYPFQVVFPLVYSVVVYYLVGFQSGGSEFFRFLFANIMVVYSAQAIGLAFASLTPTPQIAISLQPVVIIPLLLFSGFFIIPENIPVYFRWISTISPFRFGLESLLINEFKNLRLTCDGDELTGSQCQFTRGEQVLQTRDINPDDFWFNQLVLFLETIAALLLCFVILKLKKRRSR